MRTATKNRGLRRGSLVTGQLGNIDKTLAALADPTRRGVIDFLGNGPQRAGEIASAFQMSAPAMSQHLRILKNGGLVEETIGETDARVRIYQLRPAPFAALHEWIMQIESFWPDPLDTLKTHAEKKVRRRKQP